MTGSHFVDFDLPPADATPLRLLGSVSGEGKYFKEPVSSRKCRTPGLARVGVMG
jgi:hypothetical protein